jgi:hypothetical protein
MGTWKIRGCPKCKGSLIVDKDEDGWFELCINCAYRNDLKVYVESGKKAVLKAGASSRES